MLGQPDGARQTDAKVVGVLGFASKDEIQVVLQVLAHAGQVVQHRNSVTADFLFRPDPRQHQQLRRVEDAPRQQHLAGRAHLVILTLLPVRNPDRALAFHHDLGRMGAGDHRQIAAAFLDRVQICRRR